jgi:hypothetical protein
MGQRRKYKPNLVSAKKSNRRTKQKNRRRKVGGSDSRWNEVVPTQKATTEVKLQNMNDVLKSLIRITTDKGELQDNLMSLAGDAMSDDATETVFIGLPEYKMVDDFITGNA